MKQLLIEHGAHLGFVVIGVVAFFWIAYRPERETDRAKRDPRREHLERLAQEARAEPEAGHVRRSVARRGLLALGPLLAAVATGGVLYAIAAANDHAPSAVIWGHAGISALALLLVVYKTADLGAGRIRVAFTRQRLSELVSIGLALVSLPLAITGAVLLFAPSSQSFMAYAHLISSVWWTGLLAWHLRRYLGPSLRAALRGRPASAQSTRLMPVDGPGEALERRAA
jgi:hypothetical protein